ncbi:MAG: 30S ribosomal protein S20, partial [Bacillota bacterium]
MANIKQQKKRVLQDQKRRDRNRTFKGSIKKAVKSVETSIEQGDKEKALENLNLAYKKLDQALAKGIYHKNTVARKKSRLTQK